MKGYKMQPDYILNFQQEKKDHRLQNYDLQKVNLHQVRTK